MQMLQQNCTCALSASQNSKKRYCWPYTSEQGTSSSTLFTFCFLRKRRSARMHIQIVYDVNRDINHQLDDADDISIYYFKEPMQSRILLYMIEKKKISMQFDKQARS